MLNMKIFVDTDDDVRLARRIQRDVTHRGRDVGGGCLALPCLASTPGLADHVALVACAAHMRRHQHAYCCVTDLTCPNSNIAIGDGLAGATATTAWLADRPQADVYLAPPPPCVAGPDALQQV